MLKAFLAGLPGAAAGRLAMAVEVDRLMDGKLLPHEMILDGLRPVLRREQYERTPTPLRLFCRPFQDLLSCAPRTAKQKAMIARTTLVPAWHWICKDLLPEDAAIYITECRALVLAHRHDEALARAAQFWTVAAGAITSALSSAAGRETAKKALGDPLVLEDLAEMALMLSAGEAIETLAGLLPSPVTSFHEQLVWQVREIYDLLVKNNPDAAPYVPIIAMNRLAKPWEALRLPLLVTRHSDETLISQTDMGMVGEILFARMDRLKNSIQLTRHPLFDADKLLDEAKTFADLSSHIVKEIELKREGEWGKRLMAERVQIGKVMETFMDRAPREVGAALPMAKGTGADFSRSCGPEKHEMAVRYARLVAGSRNFAAAASFAAKQRTIYEDLCTSLRRYNEDLVKALKADPQHAVANDQLKLCAELSSILFSKEEAELLRRRARAAQSAAA